MRYNPNAYIEYPVLRPHSSDYPDGRISTKLLYEREGDSLRITIEFEIAESGIQRQIDKGDAVCCAFLYCSTTRYSDMIIADEGKTTISILVPLAPLRGRVELHPSVITTDYLVLRTETAHEEYERKAMPVQMRRQLALDEPWHFTVGLMGPIESVFQLQKSNPGESIADGEFDYQIDPSERYIVIKANQKTFDEFQIIRGHNMRVLTSASVYLNALTAALGVLNDERDESEPSEGWAATVRGLIHEAKIQWPEHCSDGLAAQRLMKKPLDALPELSDLVQRGRGV